MDSMYRENILDHAQNPRYPGVLDPADVDLALDNPLCGDHLRLTLRFDADDRISEIAWDGTGCAISQAAASMLAEEVIGKSRAELAQLAPQDVLDLIGFPLTMNRVKCATLSLKTLVTGVFGAEAWHTLMDAHED